MISLKKKFRCKFEDELISLFDEGKLEHEFKDRKMFLQFIKRINKKKWIIHLEPPMNIPTQVITYIGRYSKRACLSEYKITNIEGEFISFKYKDYKTKDHYDKPIEKVLTLNYRDFIPRLLQHVPLKHFRLVRYYGLYSNRSQIPQQYIYKQEQSNDNQDNWENLQIEKTGQNPLICSVCQKRKTYIYTKLRSRRNNKTITFRRSAMVKNNLREDSVA
jgi:hypothetical protein